MHPFVHPFNPPIDPLWESRSDWDIFKLLSKTVSETIEKYMPGNYKDVVTDHLHMIQNKKSRTSTVLLRIGLKEK